MSDADFIKPSDRPGFDGRNFETIKVLDSHVALDDVARELAEALRKYTTFQRAAFGDHPVDYVRDAMNRYDRMVGDDDA